MKETYYFSHDYSPREDEKIQNLIFKLKYEGYGLYWAIVEMLYQNEGYLEYDCERIAYGLQVEEDKIRNIIDDFGLFNRKENYFYSPSILTRVRLRRDKSLKAQKSAKARWDKEKRTSANALRTQCDSNAIKERKVKESKRKEKEEEHELQELVRKEYKNVSRMKYQLSSAEAIRLLNDYQKSNVLQILQAMENYAQLTKKSLSVNLTIRSWLKRDGVVPIENTFECYKGFAIKGKEQEFERWLKSKVDTNEANDIIEKYYLKYKN